MGIPAPSSGTPAGRRLVPLLVAAAALAALGGWALSRQGWEETDNAQVQAEITAISSRVPGTIARVAVQRDQTVRAGAPLVLLDDRPAVARLMQAEADRAAARGEALAAGALADSSASNAAAAEGRAAADRLTAAGELARARADDERAVQLLAEGGLSRQEAERIRATYLKALGEFTRSQASQESARASESEVGVERQRTLAALAKVQQTEAALAQARLELSYTRISAPSAGRIGDLSAEPGRQVQAGQPLMTLVGERPWVEANFKETQLAALRPGQPAEVRIDAFPERPLRGHVLSLAPASGARFALLPPENATGNFTKVVQRVTVRIGLDAIPADLRPRLVPGLSVTVRVRRR